MNKSHINKRLFEERQDMRNLERLIRMTDDEDKKKRHRGSIFAKRQSIRWYESKLKTLNRG